MRSFPVRSGAVENGPGAASTFRPPGTAHDMPRPGRAHRKTPATDSNTNMKVVQ